MFAYPAHVIAQAFEEALMTPIFDASVMPEFIREDVHEAIIDAVALKDMQPNYEADPYDFLGWSDPVALPPLELEF